MIKEVVLCKNCKHRPYRDPPDSVDPFDICPPRDEVGWLDETCPYLVADGWYSEMPEDDWFCSKGERKNERKH